ncbi:MAG: hypothetical protein QOF29_524 [bacterium]|jgi:RimJ/RimL family protein N-acetyltransferase|nr:hypothetical protein [Solirubrobacteraceae bacterium]
MRRLSLVPRRGAPGLTLRPIGPHDRAALLAAFDRLSATSRYRRFLSPKPRLTEAELTFLTDPDPARHRALVAEDPATREIVGVARYVRTAGDVATADVAVAVVDDWHRRGVGRRLMTELIRLARRDGVTRVMGTTLVDNHASRGLLRSLGFEPAAFFGDTMDLVLTLCAGAARPAAA